MAITTEELQEQYDELIRAINSGANRVKYKDKEVTYRSLNDMYKAKSELERQLGLLSGTKKRVNPIYDKGL